MKTAKRQSGIAAVELVLILLGLILIGFVGYKVYDIRQDSDRQLDQSTSEASTAPAKASETDLSSAETSLDQINPDDSSSDLTELDSQLSSF